MTADTRTKAQRVETAVEEMRRWAEGLICQLPEDHDGRNSWLLNHGSPSISEPLRERWEKDAGRKMMPTDGDRLRESLALPDDPQPQTGALRELRELVSNKEAEWERNRKYWEGSRQRTHEIVCAEYRGYVCAAREIALGIDRLLAAPAPAEPEPCGKTVAIANGVRVPCTLYAGHSVGCHADVKPAEPEPFPDAADVDEIRGDAGTTFTVSEGVGECVPMREDDAERERRVAGGDGYRALDHAMEILGSCVQPYTGEQAQKVAKALRQWSDREERLHDLIRELYRDRDAEVARLRAELDEREADMHIRIRSEYDKTVADSWRAEVERLTKERDRLRNVVAYKEVALNTMSAELDLERGGWKSLERLRASMADSKCLFTYMNRYSMRDAFLAEADKALAARPAQGKEGSDG